VQGRNEISPKGMKKRRGGMKDKGMKKRREGIKYPPRE
jgi:hypothetical protein